MNPLANPYIRIALGAALSEYLKPRIINRFVRPELEERDAQINEATGIGITAAITAGVFVILGMATGKTAAAAAGDTGARVAGGDK
jgi:hypothetical protein